MQEYLGLRGPALSRAIGVVSGLCFLLYGFDQGLLGGFMTLASFLNQFPESAVPTYPGNLQVANNLGLTVGIWNLGCLVSAVVAIFIGDRLGRKKIVFTGLLLLLVGEIIQCTAFHWGQFVAGRFIAGLGNGLNCATVPAWQAECTKAHRRGTVLMMSAGVCIAAGLTLSYWADFAFAWLDPGSESWRVPIALQLVLIVIAAWLVLYMPESPRWLILAGREAEALHVLSALNDKKESDRVIHQEFLQIKDAVIEMAQASFVNVFKMGDYRDGHRVILAVALQFFQQIGGINFCTMYFAAMFNQQYQWDAWISRLLAACAGTTFLLASFVSVYGIDRYWGRRQLMLFGTSGMLICMIVLCLMVYINNRSALDVGTAFVFIYCIFFAIGWQGMSWLYQVEIVPLRIRGPGNAISTVANWLANFIVVFATPAAFTNTTYRTYIIFIATNAVILPTIYFFYPETSLRCLEEMDVIFHAANSSKRPWLDVVKIAANQPLWYAREDVEQTFDYEGSDWHKRHVRFSEDVKDSDGDTTTINVSPVDDNEKYQSDSGVSTISPTVSGNRSRSGSGNSVDPDESVRNGAEDFFAGRML